jgi:hypothetical protein
MPRRAAAVAMTCLVPVAIAGPRAFTVDPGASSASGSFGLLADTAGTLIGDYDEAANPGGTQTRPGLFGGSGNNPIPVTIAVGSSAGLATTPAGSFTLDADTDALSATIDAFNADLLNGAAVGSSLDLTFLFETFRTVNPSSFYPGGIPLPISLPAGELTVLTLAQNAPAAPGVLVPNPDGTYTLGAAVPVTLTISGAALGGAAIDPGPVDLLLPLAGVYAPAPDGSASVSLAIDLDAFSQSVDTSALPPLPTIPFELPTLGTETASVLLDLAIGAITLEGVGSVTLIADAAPGGCNAADIAEPLDVLDLSDVIAFIEAFGAQTEPADYDDNGIFDLADIQIFIVSFMGGCP